MAEESKKTTTVFNRLQNYFKSTSPSDAFPDFDFDEPIKKVDNIEDYERILTQKRQLQYLKNSWGKITPLIYNQSLIFEATRIPAYMDYEMMEYYPIIGAALDIMMEESTVINNQGKLLNIYSNSKRIKSELEHLFYNVLNIKTSLPMWIRNMCKYGDNFIYLDLHDEMGVIDAKQLPTLEIERVDGDILSQFRGLAPDVKKGETIFRWRNQNMVQFKNWQIAHFRLLLDDKRIPYGVSVLEKARRIWKNLLLVEDAMRSLVVIRGVDRKAFYVNVGNIDPVDVPAYVSAIADRFKRKKQVDPETGQVDLKYNVLAIDQDYVIPIRGSDDGSKVETVEGQSTINIDPINYDLNQLFAALRVPKPFLNYEETSGDGKNLTMQDVRFARTVMRIQQAALQELNKIAMVHLMILGFEDDIDNFDLTLNNPSMQADLLETEVLQAKLNVYKDLVSDAGNGFAPMSMTRAKMLILGLSEDEIKLDLEQQRLEKAAALELENTAQIIPDSGMFDRVDALYGDPTINISQVKTAAANAQEGGDEMGGGVGGGGGGGGSLLGGGDLGGDMGGEGEAGEAGEAGDEALGGEAGVEGTENLDASGAEDLGGGLDTTETDALVTPPETETKVESRIRELNKLLLETKSLLDRH